MDLEQYSIPMRGSGGAALTAQVRIEADAEGCRVTLAWDGETLSAAAADYFDAFIVIRDALAGRGIVPLCYGASRNVYPSGMSRSMGGGRKAYRMTLGQQARLHDLVFIFDTGPVLDPASPEQQRAFFEDWFGSLSR